MLISAGNVVSLLPHPKLQAVIERLLSWLIPMFLLVDMLNGALLQSIGSGYGIAALYKGFILLLMALGLCLVKPKQVICFVTLGVLMLAGPTWVAAHLGFTFWLSDLQLVIKLLAPLLAFCYLYQWQKRQPLQTASLLHRTFVVSYAIVLFNILLGLLGLGYTAYQPMDNVAQSFLGIKGYFYSTNELSALLLLLNSYLLWHLWQKNRKLYVLISICSLAAAVLLLTKTGLLGTVLLVAAVPLLLTQYTQWQSPAGRRIAVTGIITLAMVIAVLVLYAEPLLRSLGIYDKLQFVYQQRGIAGILLSSRDFYADRIWQLTSDNYSAVQRVLGIGQGGIAFYLKKYFAELDLFDAAMFYGIAGAAVVLTTFSCFLYRGWHHRLYSNGRLLLLINGLLLLVALLAGHVMTSGMLWLPWAMLNAIIVGVKVVPFAPVALDRQQAYSQQG